TAAAQFRSVDETAAALGDDGRAYRRLMGPLSRDAQKLYGDLLGPFRLPRHPFAAFRFGRRAIRSGRGLAEAFFRHEPARALIAGVAAHAVLPLEQRPGAAIALMLGIAGHAVGWPIPRGGSQRIAEALAAYLCSLGGEIITGRRIATVDKLPPAK